MTRWLPAALLLTLMIGVALVTGVRGGAGAGIPERIPVAAVTPWMADCLVGIGPKRRDDVARHLRSGQWQQVPQRSRERAAQCFDGVPESWAPRHR